MDEFWQTAGQQPNPIFERDKHAARVSHYKRQEPPFVRKIRSISQNGHLNDLLRWLPSATASPVASPWHYYRHRAVAHDQRAEQTEVNLGPHQHPHSGKCHDLC